MRTQDQALQDKTIELEGKDRELQAKVGALEVKEREQRELAAVIEVVCGRLQVGAAATLTQRLLLLPQKVKNLALEQARRITRKMMGIVLAHYPSFDGETVSEGWPQDLPDEECDAAEARATDLADKMTTLAAEELGIIEDAAGGGPSVPAP
jgi:hypothetical protein